MTFSQVMCFLLSKVFDFDARLAQIVKNNSEDSW